MAEQLTSATEDTGGLSPQTVKLGLQADAVLDRLTAGGTSPLDVEAAKVAKRDAKDEREEEEEGEEKEELMIYQAE